MQTILATVTNKHGCYLPKGYYLKKIIMCPEGKIGVGKYYPNRKILCFYYMIIC